MTYHSDRDGLERWLGPREAAIMAYLWDCAAIAHRARGYCASCYHWHARHGWERRRVPGQWGIETTNMRRGRG